jgi:hypothetical protein
MGSWGFALTAFGLLGLAPTPSPPAPAQSPLPALHEIGHVRVTTPLCVGELQHADLAIQNILSADASIAQTSESLHKGGLDWSALDKTHATQRYVHTYVDLRATSLAALHAAEAVQTGANDATDPQQKAALVAFAESLEGVAARQKKMAEDLGRFTAYLEAHHPVSQFQSMEEADNLTIASHAQGTPLRGDLRDYQTPTLDKLAAQLGDRFDSDSAGVQKDEDTASTRIDPAFEKC